MAGPNLFGLQRANPFAYPAGRAPAFDWAHIAAGTPSPIQEAFVATGGPYPLNIVYPSQIPTVNTPTTSMMTGFGPVVGTTSGGYFAWGSGLSLSPYTITTLTLAAIFFTNNASPPNHQNVLGQGPGGHTTGFYLSGTPPFTLEVYSDGGGDITVANSILVGAPYFIVASIVGGSHINLLSRNLLTGSTLVTTSAYGAIANYGGLYVGNYTGNTQALLGGAQCGMVSNAYLTTAQQLQWADDPWALWYPRSAPIYLSPPPAAPGPLLLGGSRGINSPPNFFGLQKSKPFDFPVGRPAGIDLSHPAAGLLAKNGYGNSFVTTPSGIMPVYSPALPTFQAAPSYVQTPAGPIFTNAGFKSTSLAVTSPVAVTCAAIFFYAGGASTAYRSIIVDALGDVGLYLHLGDVDFWTGTGDIDTGVALTVGTPYFAVLSAVQGGSVTFAWTNLNTGQIQTFVHGIATTVGNLNGNICSGTSSATGNTDNWQSPGGIAASFMALGTLTVAQQLAWAADPWAFWYPRGQAIYVEPSQAPSLRLGANQGVLWM